MDQLEVLDKGERLVRPGLVVHQEKLGQQVQLGLKAYLDQGDSQGQLDRLDQLVQQVLKVKEEKQDPLDLLVKQGQLDLLVHLANLDKEEIKVAKAKEDRLAQLVQMAQLVLVVTLAQLVQQDLQGLLVKLDHLVLLGRQDHLDKLEEMDHQVISVTMDVSQQHIMTTSHKQRQTTVLFFVKGLQQYMTCMMTTTSCHIF